MNFQKKKSLLIMSMGLGNDTIEISCFTDFWNVTTLLISNQMASNLVSLPIMASSFLTCDEVHFLIRLIIKKWVDTFGPSPFLVFLLASYASKLWSTEV